MNNTLRLLLLAVTTAGVLAGCGGESTTANSTPTPTAAGVATPKAVSVVTAN
jgi:uncharacterized lipoprotein YajG